VGRNIGPQCRLCRSEGTKLYLKGDRCKGPKCPVTKKKGAPGKGPRSRTKKMSDYGVQLHEKQKLKRMYGMLEAQFSLFFQRANKKKGVTGENLIQMLERRMDNVVYRMHLAPSRKAARQLVLHGHIQVNGRRVSVPSQQVKVNDVVGVREKSTKLTAIKESLREFSRAGVVPWLEIDPDKMVGTVRAIPRRSEVTDLADIREQLIVELYSK
jgi:small subunit ribosomal protein S4